MSLFRLSSVYPWSWRPGLFLSTRNFSTNANVFPRRWLPFEEAREWARSLGWGSSIEWRRNYRYPNLRRDVPTDPARVYKGQFGGYADWLGSNRSIPLKRDLRLISHPDEAGKSFDERVPTYSSHFSGLQEFVDRLSSHQAQLRFAMLPRGCDAHILYQSSEHVGDSDDLWCGLFVSTCTNTTKSGKLVSFPGYRGRGSGSTFVFVHNEGGRCLLLPSHVPRCTKLYLPVADSVDSKYSPFVVDLENLGEQLELLVAQEPRYSRAEWLSRHLGRAKHHNSIRTMSSLDAVLYRPLGLNLTFPVTHSHSTYNSFLNSIRVVHRNGSLSSGTFRVNLMKMVDGAYIPLHEAEAFNLVIIGIRRAPSEALLGCFVFPKEILIEHQVISTAERGGVVCFALYPPLSWCMPTHKGALRAQEWQEPFYIDLSGGSDDLQKNRDKFLRVLHKFGFQNAIETHM